VRYIAFVGIALFALSCFMNTHLSLDVAGDQFLLPNIVRAIGQALIITPVRAITTAGIAPSEAGAASGLSNMLRNLGGAIGTAALSTILIKREQFHSSIIGEAVTSARGEVSQRLDEMTGYFMAHGVTDRIAAMQEAVVYLGGVVKRQAWIMGFSDTFAVIGLLLAVAAVSLLFARKAQGPAAAGGH
jgi:MFS transporter, DHA2 family, multidrug resistance protein